MNDDRIGQLLEGATAPPLSDESEMRMELAVFRAAAARGAVAQPGIRDGWRARRALTISAIALAFMSGWLIDRAVLKSSINGRLPSAEHAVGGREGVRSAATIDVDLWATETTSNTRVRFDQWETIR